MLYLSFIQPGKPHIGWEKFMLHIKNYQSDMKQDMASIGLFLIINGIIFYTRNKQVS